MLGTAVRIVRAMERELADQAEAFDSKFPADRTLLTPRETAIALKVSERSLAYWTKGRKPKLPFVKLDKAKRFVVADVLRFIEQQRRA